MKKFLCVLLLFAVILIAVSCNSSEKSGDGESKNSGEDKSGENTPADNLSTAAGYIYPNENFKGYEFRVLNLDVTSWGISHMAAEESTGQELFDAIYLRNRIVEDKLGFIVKEQFFTEGEVVIERVTTLVNAGIDEFDMIITHANEGGPLASSGAFMDLYEIDSIDFDSPWWNQGAVNSFELDKSLYITSTDAVIMSTDATWIMYFNKNMHEGLGVDDCYELVKSGKWTMDAMMTMMKAARRDSDGDGIYSTADVWGLGTHGSSVGAFIIGAGEQFAYKDENGYPFIKAPDERFIAVFAKTAEMMDYKSGLCFNNHHRTVIKAYDSNIIDQLDLFENERALFCNEVLGHTRTFRAMEKDYGLLPFPKYDESQSEYYSFMIYGTPVFGIPKTVSNPDRSGLIIEALTAQSLETISPVYYDTAIRGKYTRDEESLEMLDYILKNRVYDLSVIFAWGGIYDKYTEVAARGNSGTNPVNTYEKNIDKTNADIDKTMTFFAGN